MFCLGPYVLHSLSLRQMKLRWIFLLMILISWRKWWVSWLVKLGNKKLSFQDTKSWIGALVFNTDLKCVFCLCRTFVTSGRQSGLSTKKGGKELVYGGDKNLKKIVNIFVEPTRVEGSIFSFHFANIRKITIII